MRKDLARLAVAVCAAVLLCAGVRAQQPGAATLRGVVKDPLGALVPGATVRATNVATRAARETHTNGEGAYVFPNMQPGGYEVRIEAAGFKSVTTAEPVALAVGQSATMDVKLEIEGLGEVVDLIGTVPLVDTTSSKVDQLIDAREIANLPLNGRNFLELALLTPGNAPAPNFDPTKTNAVVISSAGQFGRGGSVTVDGVDTNDDVVGGAVQNVSQDAVLEFQIATNRFDARLGRTGSGLVNIVTKSGTNEFHGSAAGYFRGSLFQGLPATFDRASD